MSSFVIKTIAILTMTIDHVNNIFYKIPLLNMIGRIAFPLFCFQIVVGYAKTRNLKKYLLRLFLFAIISQIPYHMFMQRLKETYSTNVLITLFFGVIAMYLYDIRVNNKNDKIELMDSRGNILLKRMNLKYDGLLYGLCTIIKCTTIFIVMLICYLLNSDYNAWGIILVLIIHAFYPFDGKIRFMSKTINTNKFYAITMFLIIMMIMCLVKYITYYGELKNIDILKYTLFTFIPSIFILLANGKKGISLKYFFYLYYPLHILIILLVEKIIIN